MVSTRHIPLQARYVICDIRGLGGGKRSSEYNSSYVKAFTFIWIGWAFSLSLLCLNSVTTPPVRASG